MLAQVIREIIKNLSWLAGAPDPEALDDLCILSLSQTMQSGSAASSGGDGNNVHTANAQPDTQPEPGAAAAVATGAAPLEPDDLDGPQGFAEAAARVDRGPLSTHPRMPPPGLLQAEQAGQAGIAARRERIARKRQGRSHSPGPAMRTRSPPTWYEKEPVSFPVPTTPAESLTKEPERFVMHSPPSLLGEMTGDTKTGDTKTDDSWRHINDIMKTMMTTMQAQIDALNQKLAEKPKKKNEDDVPFIHSKDVDRPTKYDGVQFRLWYSNFVSFLGSKDERFEAILEGIKSRSKSPLTKDQIKAIHFDAGLTTDVLIKAFKSQMFRYLQSYTKGESHTVVLAGGQENVWESMRQLCDAGNSQQQYCKREERRRVWHPKQSSIDNLKVAIAT